MRTWNHEAGAVLLTGMVGTVNELQRSVLLVVSGDM